MNVISVFYSSTLIVWLGLAVQAQKGVLKALLVAEGGPIFSAVSDYDQLGLLANLPMLIGQCTDISKFLKSEFMYVSFCGRFNIYP